MIKGNSQPRKLREIKLNEDVLCSIWIMNHEGLLRGRYKKYIQNSKNKEYLREKGILLVTIPDMNFEEFAVFMYENCPIAIEENLN